ncbi:hypothetical protein M1N55_06465 [Dehalococcoidia bacterium]|nr:hypothetical protein [Dehalococcoidia bacterium]
MKKIQTILLGLLIGLGVIYIAYNETRISEIERSMNEIIVAQTEIKEINAEAFSTTANSFRITAEGLRDLDLAIQSIQEEMYRNWGN